MSSVEPFPQGWKLFSTQSPSAKDFDRAGNSDRFWSVSIVGDQIVISPWKYVDEFEKPFHGGLLRGRNRGEFANLDDGLTWSNADGSLEVPLLRDNVLGFLDTRFGTLALTGLAHMVTNEGDVYLLKGEDSSAPTVQHLADPKQEPAASTTDNARNAIIVTRTKILRMSSPETVEELFSTAGWMEPCSASVAPSGTIYVGMRKFIARFIPVGGSFRSEWFVQDK